MIRGSETIVVVTDAEVDWQGDPVPGGTASSSRPITGCILIPIMLPDRPDVVIDGFQVVVPPNETPPAAEDEIKILNYVGIDPEKLWFIDGNVGNFKNKRGRGKAFLFSLKGVR